MKKVQIRFDDFITYIGTYVNVITDVREKMKKKVKMKEVLVGLEDANAVNKYINKYMYTCMFVHECKKS